ncbi:hypothetical protein HAX54_011561 [Datura stramonium]|uniref:Uncharacterized protein n=1 Tax=Datura stramonium TaxID=4076 RepID=A0ABS8RX04_DATST|nr:hypothetical protein [Datura stramonium]
MWRESEHDGMCEAAFAGAMACRQPCPRAMRHVQQPFSRVMVHFLTKTRADHLPNNSVDDARCLDCHQTSLLLAPLWLMVTYHRSLFLSSATLSPISSGLHFIFPESTPQAL